MVSVTKVFPQWGCFYKNTKAIFHTPDGDNDIFYIIAGVLQGDTLAPFLFTIFLDYVVRVSTDQRKRSRWYPTEINMTANYINDSELYANTPTQVVYFLHSL